MFSQGMVKAVNLGEVFSRGMVKAVSLKKGQACVLEHGDDLG